MAKRPRKIAVVGGGISGLAASQKLSETGADVTVFDRGRRVGGRLASRPVNHSDTVHFSFDHGGAVVSATGLKFKQLLNTWRELGIVQPWPVELCSLEEVGSRFVHSDPKPHAKQPNVFVGTPCSNSIAQFLANGLIVKTEANVSGYRIGKQEVHVDVGDEQHVFDNVVIAMPIEQASRLTDTPPVGIEGVARSTSAHVAMIQLDRSVDVPASWIEPVHPDVIRLIRESDKPGRIKVEGDCWTLQTSDTWSRSRLSRPPSEFATELVNLFCHLLAVPQSAVMAVHVHRWTYGFATPPYAGSPLVDGAVVWTGDWVFGGDLEGAFLAGEAAADIILQSESRKADEAPKTNEA